MYNPTDSRICVDLGFITTMHAATAYIGSRCDGARRHDGCVSHTTASPEQKRAAANFAVRESRRQRIQCSTNDAQIDTSRTRWNTLEVRRIQDCTAQDTKHNPWRNSGQIKSLFCLFITANQSTEESVVRCAQAMRKLGPSVKTGVRPERFGSLDSRTNDEVCWGIIMSMQ